MRLASYLHAVAKNQAPANLTIELVAACNLRCVHCYVDHQKPATLSYPVVTHVIDEFADAGGLFLGFTGGEIGLRNDLFDLIAHARRRRLFVTLLSSGTLWGPTQWQAIAQSGVQRVRLSLYAMEAEVHDRVTNSKGSHNKTMATLHGLRSLGVEVQIACPVLNVNATAVPGVLTYASKLGLTVGIDARISGSENGCRDTLSFLADDPSVADVLAATETLRCHPRSPRTLKGSDRPCNVGETMAFIAASGDVRPCANWPRAAGNLSGSTLLEIFRTSPEFRRARALRRDDADACKSCTFLPSCNQCPALALEENPLTLQPSSRVCRYSRISAASGLVHGR